jgi:predicted XRE-type DNA-binding protein
MEELSRPSSNKRSRRRRDEDDLYMPRSARPSRIDSRLGSSLSKSVIVPDERSVLRLAYYMKDRKLNQRSAAKLLGISQTKLSHFLNRRAKHRGWKKLEETIQAKLGNIQVDFPEPESSDEEQLESPRSEVATSEVELVEPLSIYNNFGCLLQYEQNGLPSEYLTDDWAQFSLNQIFGNVC